MLHTVILVAIAGGLLAVLTFIHFVIDWVFQSHSEAMVKHNNAKVRAKHCAIYTLPFIPLMVVLQFSLLQVVVGAAVLFLSHFFEDTYYPVFLWARHIRRPPEMRWWMSPYPGNTTMTGPNGETDWDGRVPEDSWRSQLVRDYSEGRITCKEAQKKLDMGGFVEFIGTPLGKILMVVIDQIIHLCFLWAVIWMALHNIVLILGW